jgi:hypothetical protein
MKFVVAVFVLSLSLIVLASFSSFPPINTSGGIDEGTCLNCHGGEINPENGFSRLLIGNNVSFEQDSTYTGSLTISHPDHNLFGFSMTTSKVGDKSMGEFTALSPNTSEVLNNNYAQLGHQNAYDHQRQDSTTWRFEWKAPSTAVDFVTFYYNGRSLNASTNQMAYYRDSLKLFNKKITAGVHSIINKISIYPNPVSPGKVVQTDVAVEGVYTLYNSEFKRVAYHPYSGKIQVPNEAGFYWLKIEDQNQKVFWARLIVQ